MAEPYKVPLEPPLAEHVALREAAKAVVVWNNSSRCAYCHSYTPHEPGCVFEALAKAATGEQMTPEEHSNQIETQWRTREAQLAIDPRLSAVLGVLDGAILWNDMRIDPEFKEAIARSILAALEATDG